MTRYDQSFTFGPRRVPGVYFPPKRRGWGFLWARIAIMVAFGVSLFWFFFVR